MSEDMNGPVNENPVAAVASGAVSAVGRAIAGKAKQKVGGALVGTALRSIATSGKADPKMIAAIQPLVANIISIMSDPALRAQLVKLMGQARTAKQAAPAAPQPATPTATPVAGAARESVEDFHNDAVMEEANPEDKITLNVPLFLRLMEYAKEDAKTDMDLHDVTEKVIALSEQGDTLTMDHYDEIVSGPSGESDMTEAWDDDDYDYDDFDSRRFARRGSALHAASENNPRIFPCPTCGCENRLTRQDQMRGYQCDSCADAMESGGEIRYCDDNQEFDESASDAGASHDDIVNAIMHRIHARHLDQALAAIHEHGIESFNDTVDSVASSHVGASELGTSDISAMVKDVLSQLTVKESTLESITECGMTPMGSTGEPQVNISVSKTTTDNSGAGSVSVSGNAKDTETLNQLLKLAGLDLVVSEQPAAQEVSPCGAAAVVDVEPAHAMSITPEFDDGPDLGSASYSTNGVTLKDLLVNRMRDKFAQ